jgi:diazepam-binding inhibitor (GABA receptor modulating acyl-CoA-binding protein)
MADARKAFETAAKEVTKLAKRPSDSQMLELYALYKQGTEGDVAGDRPGMLNITGRAKYDAWAKRKGTTKDKAMQAYVDLVAKLKKGS